MSAIFFTSRAGTVQLPGAERFYLMQQVNLYAEMEGVAGEGPLPTARQLNAVLRIKTDLAKLLARLTAQLELIVWVRAENRAWLANILVTGIRTGLLNAESGWQAAAEHLVLEESEPVFIWCTQGRPFPSAEGWQGTEPEWEALGPELQWLQAEAQLLQESEREDATAYLAEHPTLMAAPFSRELRPSNWQQYFFAELEPVECPQH